MAELWLRAARRAEQSQGELRDQEPVPGSTWGPTLSRWEIALNHEGHAASVQHRYDNAYQQCMYAKGNQIQSRARAAGPRVPGCCRPVSSCAEGWPTEPDAHLWGMQAKRADPTSRECKSHDERVTCVSSR